MSAARDKKLNSLVVLPVKILTVMSISVFRSVYSWIPDVNFYIYFVETL